MFYTVDMKTYPDFTFENPLWEEGFGVIGIDEVGRGAFAGPVGVGGVVFDPNMSVSMRKKLLELGINDSKKLTAKKRNELSLRIKEFTLAFNVSFIDVDTINEVGIGKATFLGMQKVADNLVSDLNPITYNLKPILLIDAYEIPGCTMPQKGIIHGDSLSISIAAASILAKVERDFLMQQLGLEFPEYGFLRNKGYGTLEHRNALHKFGLTSHHRVDFIHL